MSIVNEIINRETRAPHVKFERRPVEDVAESKKQGRYIAKDIDFAIITSPYSKDNVIHKVNVWLENTKQQVSNGRTPQAWLDHWKSLYEAWKNGQEVPLHGTPIRGWGLISPAQQENLIQMNVLTVEDLAATNEEGLRRLGMGALDLRNKARAWLKQLTDNGAVVQEIAGLKAENERLKLDNDALRIKVETLAANVEKLTLNTVQHSITLPSSSAGTSISAGDILDDDDDVIPEPKRRGRPAKAADDEVI